MSVLVKLGTLDTLPFAVGEIVACRVDIDPEEERYQYYKLYQKKCDRVTQFDGHVLYYQLNMRKELP